MFSHVNYDTLFICKISEKYLQKKFLAKKEQKNSLLPIGAINGKHLFDLISLGCKASPQLAPVLKSCLYL